jgi:hypothetical protein
VLKPAAAVDPWNEPFTDRQQLVTTRSHGSPPPAHTLDVMKRARLTRRLRVFLEVATIVAGMQLGVTPALAAVPGTSCPVFPANNVWNTDISGLPVNPNSAAWIANSGGAARMLHPDFGPSGDPNVPYGIPFAVVDSSHPKVNVTFDYSSESDRVPYPFGPDTPIEGGAGSGGDRHALMIDRGSCTLYELYNAHYSAGSSTAGSGAVFNLNGNALRPAGWTSADAAGLPILPGLLRLDEVNAGAVRHAVRFTVQHTAGSFVWPGRHQAGSGSAAVNPPMGARFRMKAGVDISHYSPQARVILTAFQHYGLVVADNGSNWFFQGDANNAWPGGLLSELKSIPAGDFEAIDESSLIVDPNSAQARQPAVAPPPPAAPPRVGGPAPAVQPQAGSGPATTAPITGAVADPTASAAARAADHETAGAPADAATGGSSATAAAGEGTGPAGALVATGVSGSGRVLPAPAPIQWQQVVPAVLLVLLGAAATVHRITRGSSPE